MSDITAIDQSYHLDANVEVGKFTCVVPRRYELRRMDA